MKNLRRRNASQNASRIATRIVRGE